MLKKIIPFLSITALVSLNSYAQKKPEWINDPMKACVEKRDLCAVGSGTGDMVAEAKARAAVGEFFETKVQSKTQAKTTASSFKESDIVRDYEQNDYFENDIQTVSEQVLEGVEIKKRFEYGERVYALAVLNKQKAAGRLRKKLRSLDKKMSVLLKDNSRSYFGKLKKLFKTRENINFRYELVSGGLVPEEVTYAQIFEKRKKFDKNRAPIYVEIKEATELKELESLIKKWLLDNQYKIATKKKSHKGLTLAGSMKSEKLFLDVEGWVKYKFVFDLYTKNAKGEKLGGLRFDVVKTGRSYKQSYENAFPFITKHLEENLDELNFD